MRIFYKLFIFVALFISLTAGAFAQDNSGNGVEKNQTELQRTINNYILEVYKFQGNKIIQDLDTNLAKVAPTKESKIETYSNIQETLELKKKSIEKDVKIWRNTKVILTKYLNFMINEIESKKKDLR